MRKLILSGHFGENNAGDELLLKNLLKGIVDCLPDHEMVILSANIVATKLLLERENLKSKSISILYNGRWGLFEKERTFPQNALWLLHLSKAFFSADLLITGPGNIFKDNTNRFFLAFWLGKVLLARIFGTKYCFVGISAMELNHWWSKLLVNLVKDKCEFVTTRDEPSSYLLKKWAFKKVYSLSDISFYSDVERLDVQDGSKFLGINMRNFQSKHFTKDVIDNYKSSISRFLDEIVSDFQEIHFIPFCREKHQDDRKIIEKLSVNKDVKGKFKISGWETFQELERIFAESDILVATRFHSTCLAINNNVPFIAMSYDDKTMNLLKSLKMEEYGVPVENVTTEWLIQRYEYLKQNRIEVIQLFKTKSEQLKKDSMKHFQLIQKVISNG